MKTKSNFKELFNEYDKVSNRETDFYLRYLEACRAGNKRLANYIEIKILPTLRKKCYHLAMCLADLIH